MSMKSFLSSLMAVSTWALSLLDSETYPRPCWRLAMMAARDRPRRGAAVTRGLEPRRPADLKAHDAMLLAMVLSELTVTRTDPAESGEETFR